MSTTGYIVSIIRKSVFRNNAQLMGPFSCIKSAYAHAEFHKSENTIIDVLTYTNPMIKITIEMGTIQIPKFSTVKFPIEGQALGANVQIVGTFIKKDSIQ